MSELEAAAVASRGHNLVFLAPPSPAWAGPVLKGVVDRLAAEGRGLILALSPREAVDEWARSAEPFARDRAVRLAGAHTPGRIAHLLKSDAVSLLFTTPDTALELVLRSSLKMDAVSGILLLWPEAWDGDDRLAGLLTDAPKETQRIVVSTHLAGSAEVVERYCWRAPVVDLIGPDAPGPVTGVRGTPVAWRRRIEALADLTTQLDPESIAVWTADTADHDAIAHALAAVGANAAVTTSTPARSALVLAYDLPSPAGLRELVAAGDVVLLVPPGTEAYADRIAPRRRPLHMLGLLERARTAAESARRIISEGLERGPAPGTLPTLAPLFERHEATAVAAVLFELWDGARRDTPQPAPRALAAAPGRVWIGVGRRDDATPHDLVGTLVKECGVPKEAIRKVEIRETFSLVELGAGADAAEVAERLAGKTIRKRRLVARVDRGKAPSGKR